MNFEYDPQKSNINYEKHGVRLEEARVLWLSPHVTVAARTEGEPRYMILLEKLEISFIRAFIQPEVQTEYD